MKTLSALAVLVTLHAQTPTPICGQLDTTTSTWTTITCPTKQVTATPQAQPATVVTPVPVVTVSPTIPYPDSWVGFGGAYANQSTPNVAGWMSVAKMVAKSGPVYSYTTTDYTSARTRPFTLQSSVRSGIGTVVRQWGSVSIIGLADAGAALAAKPVTGVGPSTGTSIGSAFSGGGFGIYRFGKSHQFTLEVGARLLKTSIGGTQTIVEFGFGYIPGGTK